SDCPKAAGAIRLAASNSVINAQNLFMEPLLLALHSCRRPPRGAFLGLCQLQNYACEQPLPCCIMQVIESKYDSSWNKGSPSTKVLVFTDFVPTISNFLKNERGGRLGQGAG